MLPGTHKKNSSFVIIGNWKMYFSYKESCAWAAEYFEPIGQMCNETSIGFVVCPSYDAVASIAGHAQQHGLSLGAQNCSPHAVGAYTSQVSAASLAQIGCSFCIIGHSEVRQQYSLSTPELIQQIEQLLAHDIMPIVCIGDTAEEYEQQKTVAVLMQQLEPLIPALKKSTHMVYIAYEPIWSIGTGAVPSNEHLITIHTRLAELCKTTHLENIRLIYGGSVNETNIKRISKIPHIQGILVGKASTDFQKIKTIVSLLKNDY